MTAWHFRNLEMFHLCFAACHDIIIYLKLLCLSAESSPKGGFLMKKIVALLMVLCLLLGISSAALAAGAPKITKQPTTQTTNKKGTVTFTFAAKNYNTNDSGWRFVNPATGEEYTGPQMRELLAEYKGTLSVSNGKQKLTLTKVPESMNGWEVYVVLTNNGYTVNSDRVRLWCYGMAQTDTPATPTEPETVPEQPATPSEPAPGQTSVSEPEPEIPAGPKMITVSAAEKLTLVPLDSRGDEQSDKAASSLTFEDSGNVAVHSDAPVRYWIVNGIRIEPVESVTGFILKNVTTDLSISAKFEKSAAAAVEVDPSRPCQVSCTGCVFTYHAGGLSSVAFGSVPYGASIIVAASAGSDVSGGYTIDGEAGAHAGKSNFMLVVTEDTVISLP